MILERSFKRFVKLVFTLVCAQPFSLCTDSACETTDKYRDNQHLSRQHLGTAGVHGVYVIQRVYFTTTLPGCPSESAAPFATSAFAARTINRHQYMCPDVYDRCPGVFMRMSYCFCTCVLVCIACVLTHMTYICPDVYSVYPHAWIHMSYCMNA